MVFLESETQKQQTGNANKLDQRAWTSTWHARVYRRGMHHAGLFTYVLVFWGIIRVYLAIAFVLVFSETTNFFILWGSARQSLEKKL